jgi:hypothetical protein
MVCTTCGATIADKAIVCYRCGTPTATPSALRATRPPGAPRPSAWPVVLLLVAVAAAWAATQTEPGSVWRIWEAAAAGLCLVAAGAVVWRRRS